MIKDFDLLSVGRNISVIKYKDAEQLKAHIIQKCSVTLYGFDSEESVKEFIAKFPKYVKLRGYTLKGVGCDYDLGIYGIKRYERECRFGIDSNKWYECRTVVANLTIAGLSDVTGELNETGLKRINKFVEILEKLGYFE